MMKEVKMAFYRFMVPLEGLGLFFGVVFLELELVSLY